MELVLSFRFNRQNGDIGFALGLLLEGNRSVDQSENCVILAQTHVLTRIVQRAALADDDVTGFCELTAVNLDAQSFAFGFTAVLRTTYTFFVCHIFSFLKVVTWMN